MGNSTGTSGLGRPGAFLEDDVAASGPVPSTSNKIESSNARMREVLRNHRGMLTGALRPDLAAPNELRDPVPYGEMVGSFPDSELIMKWRRHAAGPYGDDHEVSRWGAGIVWAELRSSGPRRSDCE